MTVNRIKHFCSSLAGLRAGGLAGALHGTRLRRGASAPGRAAGVRPASTCADAISYGGLVTGGPGRLVACWGTLLLLLVLPQLLLAAENGERIVNRATFSSRELPAISTQVTVTVMTRTQSTVEFLKYSPGSAEATSLSVASGSFLDANGATNVLPLPVAAGSSTPIDISAPVPLLRYSTFHAGEPVFIRVTDPDQNLERGRAETVLVTVTDPTTGDSETLLLVESGADTGVFIAYLQTTQEAAVPRNGYLSVVESSSMKAQYVDVVDGSDSSADAALVDPFGIVFDTITGAPVDGATVQLIDAATGRGAVVLGDNGLPGNIYPHTVVSGSTATDAEGRVYSFTPGGYRFPYVAPGNYILRITPPVTHTAPSAVATAEIQLLSGAPFTIVPGSRGETFAVPAGPAIRVDIPVDPKLGTLRLRKSAGKSIVSAGDYLSYEVTLENSSEAGTVFSAVVTDRLPPGFRYRKGSARLNGEKGADPAISADGSTLVFNVGTIAPGSSALIRYVVGVGAGAKPGSAVNTATATTTPPLSSNIASAAVTVQEPFMQSRNIIMGRVIVGTCGDDPQENKKGMAGVGIYLEDGTFVISDQRGMFHFEGVRSGTHVVQLDLDSIPEGYRILPCEQNSRFAGRAYSQFVELQGGTMWRADFYLGRTGAEPVAAVGERGGKGAPAEGTGGEQGNGADGAATAPDAAPLSAGGAGVVAAEPAASGAVTAGPSATSSFSGEVGLEMISSQSGDFIDYRIPMHSAGVPLENLRLNVTLPPGVAYITGSSALNASSLADPETAGSTLTYRLGAAAAGWQKELLFRASVGGKAAAGELQTRAQLLFDTPVAKEVAAPEVDNILSLQREESRISLPPVVLHPHFPTFGAELSEADRQELDELAVELSGLNIERIEVTGHTDTVRIAPRSRGKYADNGALSFARARSVGRHLTAALKLPPERLYLTGRGEREPVASNRSEAGRALNRRVEVKVSLSRDLVSSRLTMVKERSGVKKQEIAGALPQGGAEHEANAREITAAEASATEKAAIASETAAGDFATASGAAVPVLAVALTVPAAQSPTVPAVAQPPAVPVAAAAAVQPEPQTKVDAKVEGSAAGKARAKEGAQERVELVSALSDGVVHYRVKLVGVKGAKKATVTLTVPESILYMAGTSRLAGAAIGDPEVQDANIIYTLSDAAKLDLRFQALLDGGDQASPPASSVTVALADAEGKTLRSFQAAAELSDAMDEIERVDAPPAAAAATTAEAQGPSEAERLDDYIEKAPGREAAAKPAEAAEELHVLEDEGILSPADGAVIASRVNAVRVVLNSMLTPVLTLDGKEIPAERVGFKMSDRESQKTLYTYLGVDFGEPGERQLRLQGIDSFGVARLDQSAKITRAGEITAIRLVSADGNVADGRTPVKVRIQLFDKEGRPVAADAELALKGGDLRHYSATGNAGRDAASGMVAVDAQGWITFQPVTASGLYRAQLAYNKATLDLETYVKPKMRDWILVGLAEGSVGYNVASGHMENLKEAGEQEEFYDKERLAFFAKGSIKGEWLLTISYDSDKKSTGPEGNALFQDIDPNAYYTLYGDATMQGYEAASRKKLFLKVERDQFYAMFGDYDTGLTVTELSRYSRRLNGLKAEYRSGRYEVSAFGSETGQSFVKDELRSDGTSGLYRLSRRGIMINSETITIESRDRFRSEVVTDRRELTRFVDYSIDYEEGTIFFKGPVASKDEKLNPIYVVVDYEIADSGNDALTYGGRAGVKFLGDTLKIGGSYIHEGHVSGDGDLYGADAVMALGPKTEARAEAAYSKSDTPLVNDSGAAYLAEVIHSDDSFEGKAYYREQQEGFGLGQQMGTEDATRKFGVEGDYKMSGGTALSGQAYRQYNLADGNVRDFIEGRVSHSGKLFSSRAGLAYASDSMADGSDKTSLLATVGGSWKTLGERLTLRADHEQALFSKDDNADFPTRTIVGADYQATRDVMLFAQQELTYGEAADTNSTRVGIKATPWVGGAISSSVANEINENGDRTFANVGLAQKWQVSPSWTVDGGLDRNQTIRKKSGYDFDSDVPPASGGEDFTAVSLGANYQQRKLTWSNRVEYRDGESEDKWGIVSGVVNEQGLSWGWTGRLQFFHASSGAGSSRSDAELRLGLAYRPPVTRWIVLDRLDLIGTNEKSPLGSTQGRRIVNNLNANYRPDQKAQLSLQYGAKYVLDEIDDEDYRGYTDLIGAEGRYDLNSTWDIALRGSLLHSWENRQLRYSVGPSVGCNVMKNAWLSLGYNLLGFHDKDLSEANFTAQGPFVQFRFKFDQQSIKEGLKAMQRR